MKLYITFHLIILSTNEVEQKKYFQIFCIGKIFTVTGKYPHTPPSAMSETFAKQPCVWTALEKSQLKTSCNSFFHSFSAIQNDRETTDCWFSMPIRQKKIWLYIELMKEVQKLYI